MDPTYRLSLVLSNLPFYLESENLYFTALIIMIKNRKIMKRWCLYIFRIVIVTLFVYFNFISVLSYLGIYDIRSEAFL